LVEKFLIMQCPVVVVGETARIFRDSSTTRYRLREQHKNIDETSLSKEYCITDIVLLELQLLVSNL